MERQQIVIRRQIGKGVVAGIIGRCAGEPLAIAGEQIDLDARNPALSALLLPVAIFIQPSATPQQTGSIGLVETNTPTVIIKAGRQGDRSGASAA